MSDPVVEPVTEPVVAPVAAPAGEDWHSGIEGINDKDKEYTSLTEYVKGAHSLREMMNNKGIMPPGENANDEDRKAFKDSLDKYNVADMYKPELPEAYKVDLLDANEALTDERKTGIHDDFRDIGLTQKQADGVMELFGKQMKLDSEMIPGFNDATQTATDVALRADFGADFESRIEAVEAYASGDEDVVALRAGLEKVGMAGNENFVRLIDKLARSTSEYKPASSEASRMGAASELDAYEETDKFKEVFNAGDTHPDYYKIMSKRRAIMART